MNKVSAVIITLNEEKNIKKCLETVKWADEIVVVDAFSKDGTEKICRQYTDRVYKNEFKGFSSQKNYALGKAENDWVFFIDADERVTPELKAQLDAVRQGAASAVAGYRIPRKNYFFGKWVKHGGLYPDLSVRFFKKSKGRFRDTLVHESVVVDGETGCIGAPLLHYTYEDKNDFINRARFYASLWTREMRGQGRKAGLQGLLLNPLFTFLKMYFFKAGFLDGKNGFTVCCLYAYYTFLKYSGLRGLSSKKGEK
jgi:glycosyltransferase involved in cell wall biosynthesis